MGVMKLSVSGWSAAESRRVRAWHIETVKDSELQGREHDAGGEDQELQVAERYEVLPVPLHVEPAARGERPEARCAQGRHDFAESTRIVRTKKGARKRG
jgi:hypothetical protein